MESLTNRRALGRSNLLVSPLGLGCWQFSKGNGVVGKFWPVLSDEDIAEIMMTSIAGGMNWFDTAEVYGWGKSEQALARGLDILQSRGVITNELYMATKWWPLFRTASSLTNTIDERIQMLGGRTIDLYQIHQPFSFSSIRSQMKSMAGLLKTGKIRFTGVSNYSAKQMREAYVVLKEYGFELVSNQVKYSLLDRRIESNDIMDTAKELGISIIAYSPLEQGLLTGKFHADPTLISRTVGPRRFQFKFKPKGLAKSRELIDLIQTLATRYERTPSQVALNWLIHYHGDTVVTIPGASKVRHAVENVGAMQFKLTPSELSDMDLASRKAT